MFAIILLELIVASFFGYPAGDDEKMNRIINQRYTANVATDLKSYLNKYYISLANVTSKRLIVSEDAISIERDILVETENSESIPAEYKQYFDKDINLLQNGTIAEFIVKTSNETFCFASEYVFAEMTEFYYFKENNNRKEVSLVFARPYGPFTMVYVAFVTHPKERFYCGVIDNNNTVIHYSIPEEKCGPYINFIQNPEGVKIVL